MDLERNAEIYSTFFMKRKWNLFKYVKILDEKTPIKFMWENLADELYLMPDNDHQIQFDDIKIVVDRHVKNHIDDIKKIFANEKDFSESVMYCGSALYLRDLRHNIFEIDVCEDGYNGCSEIISSLLSYFFGKKRSRDSSCNSVDFLKNIRESSNYDFFDGYEINDKVLKQILDSPIDFERMVEAKERWALVKENMDEFDQKTEFELLQNYERYSPNFCFFPVFYEWEVLISSILEKKEYDVILSLLLKLKYPFFQNEVLHCLSKKDCIHLCELVKKKNPPKGKFLVAILLEKWIDSLVKFGENLDSYENEFVEDKSFEKFIESMKSKRICYMGNMSTDISLFIEILGFSYIVKYVFLQKYDLSTRETSHKKNYNEILLQLQNIVLEHKDLNLIPYAELNIPCLLSLVEKLEQMEKFEKIKDVLDVLDSKIGSTNYFASIDLSENNIILMHKYCKGLLQLPKEDIVEHILKFKTSFEGFYSIYDNKYLNISREIFIICSSIYLFEHDIFFNNDDEFKRYLFRNITKMVLNQVYRCCDDYFVEHYYLLPLQLLKCVVEQIYSEEKKWFDEQIVNLDRLKMTLLVFQYNQSKLDDSTIESLKLRLQEEWDHEKNMFMQKDDVKIKKLDQIAQKLVTKQA